MLPLIKARPRVLLFDDDVSMQRLVATLLKREGYRVDVVSAGADAIAKIGKNDYRALLLDLMAPTEGGLTVIKHLREKHPKLLGRVILVTASPESVLKSVQDHVAAIVRKPFDAAALIATVGRIVAQ
jgi:DNA-binding response OmpR family regulator